MSSKEPFVVKPSDRPRALNCPQNLKLQVLISNEDSNTQRVIFQTGNEGDGSPPHHHAWDESFYVTRGEVTFTFGGQTTVCPPGTLVFIPANITHSFSFGPGGADMVEFTGSDSNAVQMFTAVDREVPPGLPPEVFKDMVVQAAGKYGMAADF